MTKNNISLQKSVPKGQEDLKTELQSGLEDVDARNRELNSQELMSKNNLKEIKAKTIQTLFDMLKDYGVDASNLDSINAFLTKLRNQDPDLAQLFEIAFTNLTSDIDNSNQQDAMATSAEYTNAGLMNKYQNLGPETMMPR